MECSKCGKSFARKWNLKRHESRKRPCDSKPKTRKPSKETLPKKVTCDKCGKTFKNLKRHLTGRKTPCDEKPKCEKCQKEFVNRTSLGRHKKTCLSKTKIYSYAPPNVIPKELCFVQMPHAVRKYLRGWKMDIDEAHPLAQDVVSFFD